MRVAGFGFRGAATTQSLLSAFQQAGGGAVSRLAAPVDKAGALAELAVSLKADVIGVSAEALSEAPVETRSAQSLAHRGVGSVAEAAALVAAGPGARLAGPRAVSTDRLATCAIAIGDDG